MSAELMQRMDEFQRCIEQRDPTVAERVLDQDYISDIWRRKNDQWRLWRRHSTPLDAGSLPGGER